MGRLISKMAAARCPGACPDDCDVVAHVRDILQLLCRYQWIYDVKITELFKERTWEKLPDDVGVLATSHGYSSWYTYSYSLLFKCLMCMEH